MLYHVCTVCSFVSVSARLPKGSRLSVLVPRENKGINRGDIEGTVGKSGVGGTAKKKENVEIYS